MLEKVAEKELLCLGVIGGSLYGELRRDCNVLGSCPIISAFVPDPDLRASE